MSVVQLPDELQQAAAAGLVDIGAGRYLTVATLEDERHLHDGMMARLKARLSTDGLGPRPHRARPRRPADPPNKRRGLR